MKKMDFLPRSALKLSTLTLAIAAAASFATTSTMAAECRLDDGTNGGATSNGPTALACGNNAVAGGTNDTVAIGNAASTTGNSTTAVGGEAFTGTVAAGT
ncbi:hypothetical protein ACS8FC_14265, partial [Psychrobacter sp. 1Y4]